MKESRQNEKGQKPVRREVKVKQRRDERIERAERKRRRGDMWRQAHRTPKTWRGSCEVPLSPMQP